MTCEWQKSKDDDSDDSDDDGEKEDEGKRMHSNFIFSLL